MRKPTHNMLTRQLKRYLGPADAVPSEWLPLIQAVNDAYHEFDKDRGLLERSLELSSEELIHANASLRESEERFRQVADSIGEWIWEVDVNGLYTYSSAAVERILGFTPEELVGKKHFYDLFAPDVREELKKAASEIIARKQPFRNLVNPNVHKDGRVIILETSGMPVLDPEGRLLGYRGADMDITERKRAEGEIRNLLEQSDKDRDALLGILEDLKRGQDALRRSEEALRQANQMLRLHFEQTPMAVIEWDLDFRVTQWNPAAQIIFGFSREEASGQHASFIVPEAVRPHVDQVWQALLKRNGGGRSTNQNRRKDGVTILCEWYNTPLVDERGKVAGVASLVQDITEREQAEEKMKQQLDELRRWQTVTLGREGRIGELKREVNALATRLGEKPRYGSVEEV